MLFKLKNLVVKFFIAFDEISFDMSSLLEVFQNPNSSEVTQFLSAQLHIINIQKF